MQLHCASRRASADDIRETIWSNFYLSAYGGSTSIGPWTQRLCVPADAIHAVAPQALIEEAAVLAMPYGTSLYALRERGRLQPKCAAALEAGAHEVVDLADEGWKDRVKALAGPRGVDVVFDPVGGALMDTAFRTLGWGGRHLVVGFASGQIGSLRGNLTIVKGASLVGVDLRQFREKEPDAARRLLQDVAALHRDGRIAPRIAARFPMQRHAEAFAMAQDRSTLGRVLLLP